MDAARLGAAGILGAGVVVVADDDRRPGEALPILALVAGGAGILVVACQSVGGFGVELAHLRDWVTSVDSAGVGIVAHLANSNALTCNTDVLIRARTTVITSHTIEQGEDAACTTVGAGFRGAWVAIVAIHVDALAIPAGLAGVVDGAQVFVVAGGPDQGVWDTPGLRVATVGRARISVGTLFGLPDAGPVFTHVIFGAEIAIITLSR